MKKKVVDSREELEKAFYCCFFSGSWLSFSLYQLNTEKQNPFFPGHRREETGKIRCTAQPASEKRPRASVKCLVRPSGFRRLGLCSQQIKDYHHDTQLRLSCTICIDSRPFSQILHVTQDFVAVLTLDRGSILNRLITVLTLHTTH